MFGSVFLFAGLAAFWFLFLLPVLEWNSARSWPATAAVIRSSEIEVHRDDDGDSYSAEFTYDYVVDGTHYTNDRYTFLQISGSRKSARKLINKYPVGSEVMISYDPTDPQISVIDNSMGWRMLFGLLPLVFITIGGLLVWAGITGGWLVTKRVKRQMRGSQRSQLAAMATGSTALTTNRSETNDSHLPADQKDAELEGPQKLKPQSTPAMMLAFGALFALVWNGIVSFLVRDVILSGFPILQTLFAIPFVLVGIASLGFCIYSLMAMFNPKVEIALSNGAVHLGDEFDLAWEIIGDESCIRQLKITVEGQESATYSRGTSTITDTDTFAEIEVAQSNQTEQIRFGTATIRIPPETMHSFDGANNKIKWSIKVHGDIPRWPDVNQTMDFRVKPKAAS